MGADAASVAADLAGLGEVATVPEWIERNAQEQDRESLHIMVALLGLATVYTVNAMASAVVISASDRRGEFAAARVTGPTRGQVVRVVLWESLAVIAIGLLLGGLAAAGTVLGVSLAVQDLVGITVVSIRWPLLAGLALGAVVVVGVTSIVTTPSATRVSPIRWVAAFTDPMGRRLRVSGSRLPHSASIKEKCTRVDLHSMCISP